MTSRGERGAWRVRGWATIGVAAALVCALAGCPTRQVRKSAAPPKPVIPPIASMDGVPTAAVTGASLITAHGGRTPVAVPFSGARPGATISWGYQVYHKGAALTPDQNPSMSLVWDNPWQAPAPEVHQGVIHFSWDDPQGDDPLIRFSYDREANGTPSGEPEHFPHPLAGVDRKLKLVAVRARRSPAPMAGGERVPMLALCYDTKDRAVPEGDTPETFTNAAAYVLLIDVGVFNPGTSTSKPSG
jgi:hypothetical protein